MSTPRSLSAKVTPTLGDEDFSKMSEGSAAGVEPTAPSVSLYDVEGSTQGSKALNIEKPPLLPSGPPLLPSLQRTQRGSAGKVHIAALQKQLNTVKEVGDSIEESTNTVTNGTGAKSNDAAVSGFAKLKSSAGGMSGLMKFQKAGRKVGRIHSLAKTTEKKDALKVLRS